MSDSPLNDIRIGQVTSQWAENHQIFTQYKAELKSTNSLAKDEAFEENLLQESFCLYVTDLQTAGRGRGNKTWVTESSGGALLSSWSFMMDENPLPTTTCLIGLALYRACVTTWPFLDWNLKAPNDIYIGNKKIAGILLETVIQGDDIRMIAGIGMNITQTPDLDIATSVVASLPQGIPLLGQDYMAFLDRLLFEIMDSVARSSEPLTKTDQLALLLALNKHPLLKEKYTGMSKDGSLMMGEKTIHWMDL